MKMGMEYERLRQRLDHDEINALPLYQYEGEICLVRNVHEWNTALPALKSAELLGFDTETRPSFRKGRANPPALLQLATADCVFLIQLRCLPFSEAQASLLASGSIVKAGVGIAEDMGALQRIWPFVPAGAADLGKIAALNGLSSHGLRTLAASLFGLRISKASRCSNWNLESLSRKQLMYAATDAWVSRLIFLRMQELGMRGLPELQRKS